MICKNFLHDVTGHVAEITSPNKAIIHFTLDGILQTAFLKIQRFYKDGKCLPDNENLNKYIKISNKVKFSCHIIDNAEPGQCKWFITNCWRHIESEQHTATLSTGIMNVAGTVMDLKQRHGMLVMTDLLENEFRVHFLASKVYIYGKRLSASKPLSSHLQIEDKVYFDAIPCFPEENNQKCNWFATCVHKGKKPEDLYKDPNRIETTETDKDGLNRSVNNFVLNNEVSSSHCQQQELLPPEYASTINTCETVKQTHSANADNSFNNSFNNSSNNSFNNSGLGEMESSKEDANPRTEHDPKLNAKMLHDIKLLTNNPKAVFAKSNGIIMGIINEEYGVILGEFQRNIFESILFHRSNAFLFKMNLAHSKLSEIFIEGDRVRFIAVNAPKQFVCEWIATQVSVANFAEEGDEQGEDHEVPIVEESPNVQILE